MVGFVNDFLFYKLFWMVVGVDKLVLDVMSIEIDVVVYDFEGNNFG